MSEFEIINPSDRYTLLADDFQLACVVCMLLGNGRYGLQEIGGDRHMPILFLGGGDEWAQATFGKSITELLEQTTKDRPALAGWAGCLESVLIGDRATYNAALSKIDDPAKRAAWRDEWHDRHRSSINDIGGFAYKWAANIRAKLAVP